MQARAPWIAVAAGDDILCQWVCRIAAASGASSLAARDLPSAFEALARAPAALVIRRRFDGVAAEQLVAFARASGSRVPVVVLGDFVHRGFERPARRLAPVVLLPDPFDARALREALRRAIAAEGERLRPRLMMP